MTTDWEMVAWNMREQAKQKPEPYVVYETIYEPSEEQKKLYFNAGRWAGGARDWNARKAFEKMNELEQ